MQGRRESIPNSFSVSPVISVVKSRCCAEARGEAVTGGGAVVAVSAAAGTDVAPVDAAVLAGGAVAALAVGVFAAVVAAAVFAGAVDDAPGVAVAVFLLLPPHADASRAPAASIEAANMMSRDTMHLREQTECRSVHLPSANGR